MLLYYCSAIYSIKTSLRSSEEISFTSSNEKNEKPSVMENIFSAKSIGVTTKPHRFKEILYKDNFESPVIRRLDTTFDDINSRVASGTSQTITNSAAFDVVYQNKRDYYDNRRFFVFDSNFNKMENYLVNGFKQQLDANINYDPKEEHANAFAQNKLNLDFSRAPYVL